MNPDFLRGMRDSVPVLVAAAPFGLLFGALAVKNGLTPLEALAMSMTVYAGASQMVGIELFGAKVAPWLVILSIVMVNFRHVLYSAALGPALQFDRGWRRALAFFVLIDPQYAESEKRREAGLPITFAWYAGVASPIYVFWAIETWLGAQFGRFITAPERFGIDFLLPIYFLMLVMGFRRRTHWLPTVVASGLASVAAYLTLGSPWHVSAGAAVGVVTAAVIADAPARGQP